MGLLDWGSALREAAGSALEHGRATGRSIAGGVVVARDAVGGATREAAAFADAAARGVIHAGAAGYNAAAQKVDAAAQALKDAAVAGCSQATDLAKHEAASAVLKSESALASAPSALALAAVKAKQVAGAALKPLNPLAKKAADTYRKLKDKFHPAQPVLIPCVVCLAKDTAAARSERMEKRNALIAKAEKSDDKAVRNKAVQLKNDMVAVEMARLSDNTYKQSFDNPPKESESPPEPWRVMSEGELKKAGIDPPLLRASKAVVYTLPPNFPYEPKTVLAFRGTTPSETEDLLTDHDQALGQKTSQYTAAKELGAQVGDAFAGAAVTGHSLGGGKAQAAGIAGELHGMMFNSAGLHPGTVDMSPEDLQSHSQQFLQYRAEGGISKAGGDPLTGLQNSPAMQKAVYGLSKVLKGGANLDVWARGVEGQQAWTDDVDPERRQLAKEVSDRVLNVTSQQAARNHELSGGKWYIPPALGEVRGLTSKNSDGTDTAAASQHSMTNLVNGFETRKFDNISQMLTATRTNDNPATYLGDTDTVMR